MDNTHQLFQMICTKLLKITTKRLKVGLIMKEITKKLLDYFGFKTLERAYLLKVNGKIIERPQHMWMRVSLGIHGEDLMAANVKHMI